VTGRWVWVARRERGRIAGGRAVTRRHGIPRQRGGSGRHPVARRGGVGRGGGIPWPPGGTGRRGRGVGGRRGGGGGGGGVVGGESGVGGVCSSSNGLLRGAGPGRSKANAPEPGPCWAAGASCGSSRGPGTP